VRGVDAVLQGLQEPKEVVALLGAKMRRYGAPRDPGTLFIGDNGAFQRGGRPPGAMAFGVFGSPRTARTPRTKRPPTHACGSLILLLKKVTE
jgi:hypothetical protein